MAHELNSPHNAGYHQWMGNLKTRYCHVQLKAAVAINTKLLQFYRGLGADIVAQQASKPWGNSFLDKLSQHLMQAFSDMKGFSKRNLEQTKRWHQFWNLQPAIAKQAAAQFATIISLLLCKNKDKLVAEYALSNMNKPRALATYQLQHTLPAELQEQLPSIEALELKGVENE